MNVSALYRQNPPRTIYGSHISLLLQLRREFMTTLRWMMRIEFRHGIRPWRFLTWPMRDVLRHWRTLGKS